MKPADRQILDKIDNNKDGYVVLTSTNNINEDDATRLIDFYNLDKEFYTEDNIDDLAVILDERLSDSLFNNDFPEVIAWQDTVGYYNNKLNVNSFILLVDISANIEKFVHKLNERVPEDETIVFLASSQYTIFKKPVEHCTYVNGQWIRYNTRDEYRIRKRNSYSTEAKKLDMYIDRLLESHSLIDNKPSKEEILMMGYEMAGKYYDAMSFKDRAFDIDDFKQEAYFILADLYDSGDGRFDDITEDNIKVILDQILKTTVFNELRRQFRRDYQHFDLDSFYEDPYKDLESLDLDTAIDVMSIDDDNKPGYIKTPEEQYEYDNAYGKFYDTEVSEDLQVVIKDITDEFSKYFSDRPYKGRRYIYIFKEYEDIAMSPRIIVTLLLAGFSLNDLLEAFMPESSIDGEPINYIGGKRYASHSSPGSFIRDKFHLHRRELSSIIKRKPIDQQVLIYKALLELFENRVANLGALEEDDELLLDTLQEISLKASQNI